MNQPQPLADLAHAMPKVLLHEHLDGSLRVATLFELLKSRGLACPAADAAALERWFDVRSFAGLFVTGVAMVALFCIVWVFFVYRGDRYVDLRAQLAAQIGRARS